MNKWSLLLFPVLWLLQSATSERIFVDGRHGRFDNLSRSLLSDKRLTIYEQHCADQTYNEIRELTTPTRDIRSRLGHRLEQRRLSSGNSIRVSRNASFRSGDSPRYDHDKNVLRDIKFVTRENYGDTRADRTRYNYDHIPNRIERNRERSYDFEPKDIVILRSRNIRDSRRSALRDDPLERNNRRESHIDERRNTNMDRRLNFNRRSYEDKISDEILVRDRNMIARFETGRSSNLRIIQRENERTENRRSCENRQNDERQERQVFKFNLHNGDDFRYVSIKKTERSLEQASIRKHINEGLRRVRKELFVDRVTRNDHHNRDTRYQQGSNDQVLEEVLRRKINNKIDMVDRYDTNGLNRVQLKSVHVENRNEVNNNNRRAMDIEKKQREECNTNRHLVRQGSHVKRTPLELPSRTNYENLHYLDRDDSRNVFTERRDQNRFREIKNSRERRLSEENNRNIVEGKRETTVINTDNHRRNEALRRTRIFLERYQQINQLKLALVPERESDFAGRRIGKERISKKERFAKEHIALRTLTQENVMDNAVVNKARNSNTLTRNEREKLIYVEKHSSNLKTSQNEKENRMQNNHRQNGMNILKTRIRRKELFSGQLDTRRNSNRIEETRRARTYTENSYEKTYEIGGNAIYRRHVRASDENRSKQIRNIHEFRLNEKPDNRHHSVQNRNSVMEIRVDRVRSEFGEIQNKITERTIILLKYKKGESTYNTDRNFEQRILIHGDIRQPTRTEEGTRTRITNRREVRSNNDKSHTRNIRQKLIMGHTITENLSYESHKTNRELRTRQIIRNISPVNERGSINTLRDLLEPLSDKRREADTVIRARQNDRLGRSRDIRLISYSRSERDNDRLGRSRDKRVISNSRSERDTNQLDRSRDIRIISNSRSERDNDMLGRSRDIRLISNSRSERDNIMLGRTRDIRLISNSRSERDNIMLGRSRDIHLISKSRSERDNIMLGRTRDIRLISNARSERDNDMLGRSRDIRLISNSRSERDNIMLDRTRDIRIISNSRSERDNDMLDRSRDIRLISNSRTERDDGSLTRSGTNEQVRGSRKPFIRIEYHVLEQKNQSDNQILAMKWQYVFYLLQGLYILGIFTIQMRDSEGMLNKSRFSNCFLQSSILKLN